MCRKWVLVLVLVLMPLAAVAGKVDVEVRVALVHAKLAEQMPSLAVTQVHLHHVINCLVGAKGAAFDAKAGNPCAGKGDGALQDAAPVRVPRLHAALVDASRGVSVQQLDQAQTQARATAQELSVFLAQP